MGFLSGLLSGDNMKLVLGLWLNNTTKYIMKEEKMPLGLR